MDFEEYRALTARGEYLTAGSAVHRFMVAAGAVVSRDVPANTVVAGVPAKIIRTIGGKEE